MSILFHPKEHGDMGSSFDQLPPLAKLDIEIHKSGLIKYLTDFFKVADLCANTQDLNNWRESEIFKLPNSSENLENKIEYVISQANLQAIINQDSEQAYAKVYIEIEPGNLNTSLTPIITINGHEETYRGPLPKKFTQEDEAFTPLQLGLIQAMMVPHVNQPQANTDTPSSLPSPQP